MFDIVVDLCSSRAFEIPCENLAPAQIEIAVYAVNFHLAKYVTVATNLEATVHVPPSQSGLVRQALLI